MSSTITAPAPWITSTQQCTLETCPLSMAHNTYLPNLAGNALYVAIFSFFIFIQLIIGVRMRTWSFMITTICGLILEVLGYAARIKERDNPFIDKWFTMSIVCLTIAPAFLSAAIYLSLARIVGVYTTRISRLKQRSYSLLFVACDIISLLLQAAGGAMTTSADASTIETGKNILIAGLAFQVASLTLYLGICGDLAWRVWRVSRGGRRAQSSSLEMPLTTDHTEIPQSMGRNAIFFDADFASIRAARAWAAFLFLQGLATICIYVRCVFRVAELSGGFDSRLANDEVAFMVLEGAMISIAVIALSSWGHPGMGFQGRWAELDYPMFFAKRV
ncbi:RTA1-domain-containing protein [Aspergillus heterothallicus]